MEYRQARSAPLTVYRPQLSGRKCSKFETLPPLHKRVIRLVGSRHLVWCDQRLPPLEYVVTDLEGVENRSDGDGGQQKA